MPAGWLPDSVPCLCSALSLVPLLCAKMPFYYSSSSYYYSQSSGSGVKHYIRQRRRLLCLWCGAAASAVMVAKHDDGSPHPACLFVWQKCCSSQRRWHALHSYATAALSPLPFDARLAVGVVIVVASTAAAFAAALFMCTTLSNRSKAMLSGGVRQANDG